MADFPLRANSATPLFVHAARYGLQREMSETSNVSMGSYSSTTWVAKLVQYNPVSLPFDYPVGRVWWANGSTTTTSNVDFGVYSWDGTAIYRTGTTVQGTGADVQYVTPTAFVLPAGRYYFAWTNDNTTNRASTVGGAVIGSSLLGLLEETTGSFGLPATMTPVSFTRVWAYNACGLTRTTTGF